MRLNRRTLLSGTFGAAAVSLIHRTSAQQGVWTLLDDSGGPAARWDHALLADQTGNRLFLFGGRDGNGAALGDLWAFDIAGNGWSLVDTPGPSPRFGVAAAKLPDDTGFLLFGGQSADLFFNDIWTFDYASSTWTLLNDGASDAPSARYGLGGDFDADGRFVVSHGFTFEGRFDDTWAFDAGAGTWTNVTPADFRPLPRCLHEVNAIDDGKRLLLYAGCSSGYGPCPQGDLWVYDVATSVWSELVPPAIPAPRSNPALSASDNEVLLVGGLTDVGQVADVWQGSIVGQDFVWTEVTAASNVIPARSSHDMAVIGAEHYVFGGLNPNGTLADLWRYSPDS